LVNPQSGQKRKLTQGASDKIQYRVENIVPKKLRVENWFLKLETETIDIEKGLVFKGKTLNEASGYYLWRPNGQIKKLMVGNLKMDILGKASEKDIYLFEVQSFNISPSLWLYKESKLQELVKTNPQQKD